MTIIAAVPDTAEGALALSTAVSEARLLGTDLVAVNLGREALDTNAYDDRFAVLNLSHLSDQVDGILAAIAKYNASRLVIGIKRRTPVGKAVIGSISQQLLLHSPVPVLAVKMDEESD